MMFNFVRFLKYWENIRNRENKGVVFDGFVLVVSKIFGLLIVFYCLTCLYFRVLYI